MLNYSCLREKRVREACVIASLWGCKRFFLTCSRSTKHTGAGEAHVCSHLHAATPAGCKKPSSAGAWMAMGAFHGGWDVLEAMGVLVCWLLEQCRASQPQTPVQWWVKAVCFENLLLGHVGK